MKGHLLAALPIAFLLAAESQGARVNVTVSAYEVSMGEALIVEVSVINAERHEPPHWPKLEDFLMTNQSGPSRQAVTFNTVTNVTDSYHYQLTPKKMGRLMIPSIIVSADGENLQTEPITILVKKSEMDEFVFVELVTDKTEAYVQERIELSLEVWIRPFRQGAIVLGARDMYTRISNNSQWGIFSQAVETAKPTISTRSRTDADGNEHKYNEHKYFVYRWTQPLWPERAGPLELDPITVFVKYPERLSRSFFGELSIAKFRTLIRRPSIPEITVKPIPEAGKPKIYDGAVGTFTISVAAKPTDVRVGDPITLSIKIFPGTGRLDYVSAPKLELVPAMVENFKVHEEALPGQIDPEAKRFKLFTQSIRAKSADVTEIPPIPFAYFDPATQQFRTIHSKPIGLKVEEAQHVDAEDVVAAAGDRKTRLLTETTGGLFANYSDPSVLLASQSLGKSWLWAVVAVVCPAGYVVTLVTTRRRRRLREDVGFARRRSAGRRARKALGQARMMTDPAERAAQSATAVMGYIGDRLNLPAGGMTRPDVLEHLRRNGLPHEVIGMTDGFLAACEAARFAGQYDVADGAIPAQARKCLDALEKQKLGSA